MLLTVISSTANILGNPQEPHIISNDDSQLLYGEQFFVEESHGAYVYGYSIHDNYAGYVERDQLIKEGPKANSLLIARSSHFYPEPSFKSRPLKKLSFLSRLAMTEEEENGFTKTESGNWIFSDHFVTLNKFVMTGDMAQTATIYLGTPYIYGGRSSFGIDCAGLVQNVVVAHGHSCPPRDTKLQEGAFGEKIERKDVQRNDIVYFKGHVGIMIDDKYIINATARHMSTVIEELDIVEKEYEGITHIARL